jgi:DNA-binding transcriptional ArsR family regulator
MTDNSVSSVEEAIMPSNKSTRKASSGKQSVQVDTAAVAATSAAPTAAPAFPSTAPDTAATRALWATLTAQPGATAAELAEAAGMGRSTATRTLAILEEAGAAVRTPGGREGARRLPDRWRAVGAVAEPPVSAAEPTTNTEKEEDAPAADAEPEPVRDDQPGANGDATAETADGGSSSRLGAGKLRDMVLNHLREHPDEEWTPSAMGKALARSAGAIFNACQRLTADGTITQTSEKPRRFRVATGG